MLKIVKDSHVDHGLSSNHVEWLLEHFKSRSGFFIETVELPEQLSPVDCNLYGPNMGDEPVDEADVYYAVRGDRKWTSRLITLSQIKPRRKTRKLTVVAGPAEGESCVLYTSYGGPAAPREPGDTTLSSWEDVLEARSFWKVHALSLG